MCNQVQCTIPVSSCSEQRDEQKKKTEAIETLWR